ncbi:uncharacterized protein SOCE26_063830 [Sorangium cellulosum]|uniref:Uncharacterized protein n=1 Tax=Sorangium cellulosum TaxID=56 RepID=A0A2L0F050_SORCE|nr:uncharacterized protein SOCE26_063830 [Sorangium cellulosum]
MTRSRVPPATSTSPVASSFARSPVIERAYTWFLGRFGDNRRAKELLAYVERARLGAAEGPGLTDAAPPRRFSRVSWNAQRDW